MSTKGSFYNGNATVYTDTNPPGPSDAPMPSPDGNARTSFYEASGQQYAAIDLADQSVADVEANAAQATMMEAYAQSAAGVAGAFLREAHRIYASIKQTIGNLEARLAGYVANASQAARRSQSAASSAESAVASQVAAAAGAVRKAQRTVENAYANAQSAISARVAEAASYAKRALQASTAAQAIAASVSGIRAAAEVAARKAKQHASSAELSVNNALAAANVAWGWTKRSMVSAAASASSASAASSSASAASTSASAASSSASAAASSAASLTDDQIAMKAQVFN